MKERIKHIKGLRAVLGLSIQDAANIGEVCRETWSRYERGLVDRPSPQLLHRLQVRLHVMLQDRINTLNLDGDPLDCPELKAAQAAAMRAMMEQAEKMRLMLGYSQARAAEIVGISAWTWGRYALGHHPDRAWSTILRIHTTMRDRCRARVDKVMRIAPAAGGNEECVA